MDKEVLKKQMADWRHQLHAHPETAFEEKKTAELVAGALQKMGLEVHCGIGGTGVVANLRAGDGKEVIALRADMDAIELPETGTPEWRSQTPGKMHGCGHDGHTATLLGAAALLCESRDFNGTVRFIFQPAEEPGQGAKAMMADGLLEKWPIDEIYGLHNLPTYPVGTIATRAGGIMASEDDFTIRLIGKGGHASSPHACLDPFPAAAELILALQTIPSRSADPLQPAVVSCTELHTDGAHNSIPTSITITGDTRSFSPDMQKLIETRMEHLCKGIAEAHGLAYEFSYTHEFAPTYNTADRVPVAVAAAAAAVGPEHVIAACEPMMASEDFGTFLTRIPGCFVFLGSARPEDATDLVMCHNSRFDYNDEILLTGAEFFAALIRQRLPK